MHGKKTCLSNENHDRQKPAGRNQQDRDKLEEFKSNLRRRTRTRNSFATQGEKAAESEAPKCCETRCAQELWLRYVEKLNCLLLLGFQFREIPRKIWQGRTLVL